MTSGVSCTCVMVLPSRTILISHFCFLFVIGKRSPIQWISEKKKREFLSIDCDDIICIIEKYILSARTNHSSRKQYLFIDTNYAWNCVFESDTGYARISIEVPGAGVCFGDWRVLCMCVHVILCGKFIPKFKRKNKKPVPSFDWFSPLSQKTKKTFKKRQLKNQTQTMQTKNTPPPPTTTPTTIKCTMNAELVAKSIGYHGQPLQKVWEGEQGDHSLFSLGITMPDYSVYQKRQKHFAFQDRTKRLKMHLFIAKKAKELFAKDPANSELAKSNRLNEFDGSNHATSGEYLLPPENTTSNWSCVVPAPPKCVQSNHVSIVFP